METDEEFWLRMANTFGLPSQAEAERIRRIDLERSLDKILRKRKP
ncbi:hypothetical protein [Rhodopseudomonas palustris]|nr:hypothetical protein [Rhodopseudomonas palustris]